MNFSKLTLSVIKVYNNKSYASLSSGAVADDIFFIKSGKGSFWRGGTEPGLACTNESSLGLALNANVANLGDVFGV